MDLLDLHKTLLEIAKDFDSLCTENHISYYLMGGSALGAIRHKGFIPWDDDFDVFMDAENYYRFLSLAESKLDKNRYHLQKEDSLEWPLFFSKLRLNGTTFIEPNTRDSNIHQGIFIDVMCLHNVFENPILRRLQFGSALLLTAYSLRRRGYEFNSGYIKKLFIILAGFIDTAGLKPILFKFVRCLDNNNTNYVGHFFGKANFNKTSFPQEWLGKPRYVPFGETFLPVPEKVEHYLKLRYGNNYMDLPDEKTLSMYPAHASFFDTQRNYTEYLTKNDSL